MGDGIFVSQITTSQWGFEESVENYARTDGINGIGVWPDKLSEVGAEKGARHIRDAGLAASYLVFVAGFTQDLRGGGGRRSLSRPTPCRYPG